MERFIKFGKEKYTLIGGALIALILFMGVMIYSSKAYANEEYWDIKIDDKTVAVVSSESEGNKVVEGVKNAYVIEGAKVDSVSFDKELKSERHKFANDKTPEISSSEDVVKKIIKGVKGEQTYTIKDGDTAWDLAYENGLSYEQFMAMNKSNDFDPENIMPGDEVVISEMVPYINVTTKQTFESEEVLAPEIEYIEDDSMYEGETKIKEEGKVGSKLVKYSQTSLNNTVSEKVALDEKITKESEKTVILKGTKERPAAKTSSSRGSSSYGSSPVYGSGKGATIAATARSLVGSSMDCVALVSRALAGAGISFSGWPEQFFALGPVVSGGIPAAQPGDILIYQHTIGANGGAHYDHVAVYIGGGMAVHGGWNGGSVVVASAYAGSGISVVRP